MLKTKIYANAVTNLTDARYFAAWEVAWLGFCLDAHTNNFIAPQAVMAMKEWLEGPRFIGEFGLQSANEINELIASLQLDGVRVGMFVGEDVLEQLNTDLIIKEIVLTDIDSIQTDIPFHVEKFEAYAQIFVINFVANNIRFEDLHQNHLYFLQDWASRYNFIINIDLQASDLDRILSKTQALGLQVQGGAEEKVGYKSFDELDDIFEALEVFE